MFSKVEPVSKCILSIIYHKKYIFFRPLRSNSGENGDFHNIILFERIYLLANILQKYRGIKNIFNDPSYFKNMHRSIVKLLQLTHYVYQNVLIKVTISRILQPTYILRQYMTSYFCAFGFIQRQPNVKECEEHYHSIL